MAPPNLRGSLLGSFTGEFANNLGLIACKLLTLFLYSYMLLFKRARGFCSRFLLSRNHKIQIVAHVGGKSAVVLSGLMEASYSHFFVGIDFDCSRGNFLAGHLVEASGGSHLPSIRSAASEYRC